MSSNNNSATTSNEDGATPAPACVPCHSLDRSHLLQKSLVETRIAKTLPLWNVGQKSEGSSVLYCYIYRTFTAKNFQAALDAINAMGAVAEAESHHPNFHLTNYREVLVEIWTHSLGGLTENDLILAQALDTRVRIEYSPKWLQAHPEACSTALK